ncbi:fatty acid oxygenase like protein [Zymoseptoria brevis]|uniref:Fatty acid oxygenase like protein n=1 Tax=Zymoseptoria brevis TaxID=1047168 RepID=A0A0F4GF31_9PEZI|nr:fatty acid oxygenase like protein [Zymoseptoria brevis]
MDSFLKRFSSHRGSRPDKSNGDRDQKPAGANGTSAVKTAQTNGTKEMAPVGGSSAAPAPPEPEQLSTLDQMRKDTRKSMEQLGTLLKAIRAPLPTQTGDGSALPQPKKETFSKDVREILRDIPRQDIDDIEGLIKVFKSTAMGENLDDKEYLMEGMIAIATKLPESFLQDRLTTTLVTTLWNDLEHPPNVILGEEYEFRQPDGSNNNFKYPNVGKAGMPYARTVNPKSKQGGVLPDPGVLFDTVMARKHAAGEKHPNRISSMLFYLASIIIHDIFRTDHLDARISNTSSYLDLSPLYGSTWKEQKTMRTFQNGKIKPDCFAETRLLSFPPGCGALLIMFNRYHNYVVEQLALINEDGRFTENPRQVTVDRYGETGLNKRDDDLFQTARLIVCGLYINIILIDYVRTILNLNRTDDNWQLDPRVDIPGGIPVATGNQCSAEFNLVYRWHSAVSERDDLWTQQLFRELPLPDGLTAEDAAKPENMRKFLMTLAHMQHDTESKDPTERDFPALKSEKMDRIPEGPFKGNYKDDDLVALLTSSIEDCANAMGPQQVPPVMKAIEILGIQQARTWRCATLNEFREHFHLKPHKTFEDITTNKEVSEALKHLYNTPDDVELYPGLVVEDDKQAKLPGSGLCPSYTTSRGVLSDAVALVRGDRFYTTAYTPASLTNWGFQEASSDLSIDNGCVFYKLFLRALPNSYDPGSVYVHYPMTIPDEMKTILQGLEKDHMYNFDKPKASHHPVTLFSHAAGMQVTENQEDFHVTWGPAMVFLMGPKAKNFMLAGDGPENAKSRAMMEKTMYQGAPNASRGIPSGNEKWLTAVRDFYEMKTTELLKQKSYKLAGVNNVDIIRDVGNLAHVHFCAELFSIPLKTEKFPLGIFTEQQLYLIMAAVFTCVFFDLDPPKSFPLRQKARAATQSLGNIMKAQVQSVKTFGKLAESLIDVVKPNDGPLGDYGVHMIAQLCKQDFDVDDLVWGNIMGTAGGMVANQGQLLGQALDYFFTTGKDHLPDINRLAKLDTPEADDTLMHYLMEGARLNGETAIFRTVTKDTTVIDHTPLLGEQVHHLKKGDTVFVNLKSASRDAAAFPNPDILDLTRDLNSYITLGHGVHQCMGLPMTRVALTTMLKVIGRLDNLRPAPVSVGTQSVGHSVKKVMKEFVPGDKHVLPEEWHYHLYLTEDWDQYFPFPTSLKINFDGEIQ